MKELIFIDNQEAFVLDSFGYVEQINYKLLYSNFFIRFRTKSGIYKFSASAEIKLLWASIDEIVGRRPINEKSRSRLTPSNYKKKASDRVMDFVPDNITQRIHFYKSGLSRMLGATVGYKKIKVWGDRG